MKTKMTAFLMAMLLLTAALAGCSSGGEKGGTYSKEINLNDMYTLTDPEGLEYDERYVMYMPILESDETYAQGKRYFFSVLYGLENKGQYMYSVEIFETEEQAAAYQEAAGNGRVDGKAVVTENNADFFVAMEAFIPTLEDWVNSQKQSGMMDVEQ